MNRKLPAYRNTESWNQEINALMRFKRALRKADADAFDQLLQDALQFLPPVQDPGTKPLETVILCLQLAVYDLLRQLTGQPAIGDEEPPCPQLKPPVKDRPPREEYGPLPPSP